MFLFEFKANWILPFFWFVSRNKFRLIFVSIKFPGNNNFFSINTPFGNGNSFLLYYLTDIQESTFGQIKYIIEKKKANAQMSNHNKMNAFHFLAHFSYKKWE